MFYGRIRQRIKWRRKVFVIYALAALLLPIAAFAQDTTIRFTNSTPVVDVPILNGSTPVIDQDGNIYAQCQLQTGLGVCEGLDTAPAGTPPTLTLARSDGASPVTTDTGITLAWTTGNAPALCYASASPSDAAWSGAKSVSGGSQALTFSTTGSKTYSLTCYNNSGASPTRSVTVSVQAGSTDPPDPEPANCDAIPSIGKTKTQRTWGQAFFDLSTAGDGSLRGLPFFTPTSYLHPIGSYSTVVATGPTGMSGGVGMSTNYLTIPFVPVAGQAYKLDWAEAQPVAVTGYNPSRHASTAFVTISPCPGDFRAENNSSSDQFLKRGCRRSGEKNSIAFSTRITSSTTSNCAVVAGEAYYLNFNLTCASGTKCEVNVVPNTN